MGSTQALTAVALALGLVAPFALSTAAMAADAGLDDSEDGVLDEDEFGS